ncbi:hypothetical protein AB0H51_03865 [Streptomyces griseoluteus]|uniref:hypothetical protein n=1 Tax=Streptomyces griseoluteus TaxID=29306 RepID=UPI0033D958D3
MSEKGDLLHLIGEFISGRDTSMESVQKIEGLMIDLYLDSDEFEDAFEALSLYRPGAGLPYMDEKEMSGILAEVRDRIS